MSQKNLSVVHLEDGSVPLLHELRCVAERFPRDVDLVVGRRVHEHEVVTVGVEVLQKVTDFGLLLALWQRIGRDQQVCQPLNMHIHLDAVKERMTEAQDYYYRQNAP